MKDTDKVTITVGQLKKLVKESNNILSKEQYEIDNKLVHIWTDLVVLLNKSKEITSKDFQKDIKNAIKFIDSAKLKIRG